MSDCSSSTRTCHALARIFQILDSVEAKGDTRPNIDTTLTGFMLRGSDCCHPPKRCVMVSRATHRPRQ